MTNQIFKVVTLICIFNASTFISKSEVLASFDLEVDVFDINSVNDYEFHFDVDASVCISDENYSWNQTFPQPTSGSYEVTFTSSTGVNIEILVTSTLEEVFLPIFLGVVTWEITDVTPSSSWSSTGSLKISTQNEHHINLIPFDSICNNTIGDTLIYLSGLIEDQPEGIWFLNGIEIVEDYVSFSGNASIIHELSFSTIGFESLCPGYEASFSFVVYSCDCINVYLEDKYYCNTEDKISQYDIFTGFGYEYEISILNPNNLVDSIENLGSYFSLKDKSPGVYQILFEYKGMYMDDHNTCQEFYTAKLHLEEQLELGSVDSIYLFCDNIQDELDLNSFVSGSSGVGNWFLNNAEIDSIISFSALEMGLNEFIFFTPPYFACNTDSLILNIVNSSSPVLEITNTDVSCFGQNDGSIEVEILNEEYGPFNYVLNDETIDKVELIEDISAGEYQLVVNNEWNCTTNENIIINEPELLVVSLGEDKIVEFEDLVTIEALINVLQSDISNISWSDLDGTIDENDLILVRKAIENNTLMINVEDVNGCVDTDEINIFLLDKDIELPNVINLNSNTFSNTRFGIPEIPSMAIVKTFQIYDRWGELVFKKENFTAGTNEAFWDGTFNEKQVMQGVFVYFIEYENHFAETKQLKGSITVLK